MNFSRCALFICLFLAQALVCDGFAQYEGKDSAGKETPGADDGEKGYEDEVSKAVEEGRQIIAEQKERLAYKKRPKEEMEQEAIQSAEEARREVYQQKIIQEAATPPAMTMLERQLERERFRREIMALAGREIAPPFKLRKKFNMRLSETYDDNIFLTKTSATKDYITKLSPSILFSLSSKYISFDANYVMDITEYKKTKKQSGISHLLATYIRPGSINLPFFKRHGKIGLEMQDDFQPLVTNLASSEQTARTERTYNKLFLALDYYMSEKRTLALEYTNVYQDYRTSDMKSYSYTQNVVSPTFYFHVRPKWSVLAGYDYTSTNYPHGTLSSITHDLRAGITGRIFTKTLVHGEIGEEWRLYENSSNGKAQKIFFKTALVNKFTASFTGSLEFNHTIEESTYTSNPYYVDDIIDLNLEYKLSYKTVGSLRLAYGRDSYDRYTTEDGVTKKRQDYLWNPNIGVRHYFRKWLSADLQYEYKGRTSNFGKFGYVDNRFTGGVNILL